MGNVITAIILFEVRPRREYDVIETLQKIPQIKEEMITYGIFDIYAKVEVEKISDLDKILTQLRQLDGVERTITLIGV